MKIQKPKKFLPTSPKNTALKEQPQQVKVIRKNKRPNVNHSLHSRKSSMNRQRVINIRTPTPQQRAAVDQEGLPQAANALNYIHDHTTTILDNDQNFNRTDSNASMALQQYQSFQQPRGSIEEEPNNAAGRKTCQERVSPPQRQDKLLQLSRIRSSPERMSRP